MRNTKKMAALILAVVMVVSAAVMTSCQKKVPAPVDYLLSAAQNTPKSIASSDPLYVKAFEDAATLGIELAFRPTDDIASLIPIGNVTLSGAAGKSSLGGNLNVAFGETAIDLSAFADESNLAIGSDLLLGGIYGLDLKNASKQYASSVFAGENSPFPIPEETFNAIIEAVTGITSVASGEDEKLSETVDRYVKIIDDTLNKGKYATVSSDKSGTTVTITVDNAAAEQILRDLYNAAKDDKDLRALVEKYLGDGSVFSKVSPMIFGMVSRGVAPDDDSDWDLDNDGSNWDLGDEPAPEIDLNIDVMAAYDKFFSDSSALDKAIKEMNDAATFKAVLTVKTDSKDVVRSAVLSLDATPKGEGQGTVTVTLDMQKDNEFTLTAVLDGAAKENSPYSTVAFKFVTEETAASRTTTVTVDMAGEGTSASVEVLSFTQEKSSGAFKAVVGRGIPGMEAITIEGTVATTDKSVTVSVSKLSAAALEETFGKTELNLDVTLTLTAGAAVPSAPSYTNLLTMTEDDMNALLEKISGFIGILMGGGMAPSV